MPAFHSPTCGRCKRYASLDRFGFCGRDICQAQSKFVGCEEMLHSVDSSRLYIASSGRLYTRTGADLTDEITLFPAVPQ